MKLNNAMERYIMESQEELRELIRDLCAIPAPSHHEEERAAFCRDWFEKNCAGAYIDEALNVICSFGDTGENDLVVFMAHTDTVFPDLAPLPFSERDGKMYCPGVTDDTANLAVLMICARWFFRNCRAGERGMLFVANSCEEGLGNLKGTRAIMKKYGGRVRELITLDGTHLPAIVTEAVGSHRYRVSVRTEGGHSFGNFGRPNAIHALSMVVNSLYNVKVPRVENSKTTYNVGMISGGTSVNTIAQSAEMLYEYRSDNEKCLAMMEDMFSRVIEYYRSTGMNIESERIGERPCSGEIDPEKKQALLDRARASLKNTLGLEAVLTSGSTDANIPLSMGIPAICISVCNGGGCHTREEWLDLSSLPSGCRFFMDFLASYMAET